MYEIIVSSLAAIAVAIFVLYCYMTANTHYFRKHGVPYITTIWGAQGNNIAEYSQQIYNQFVGEK